ncbi:hypothetical protein [Comamonas terrae]|uniref:Uncharacterized protein n=1 Tax=Comamonas terrae TaxID=673548 RepID=A0ABW5UNC1_9BURK|nr:hypothetical protein [Comamonas terrae]
MNPQAKAISVVVLLALSFVAGWHVHGWRTAEQSARTQVAQAGAALESERETGNKERQHAASTQKASDDFTQKQPARDADLRADLDRVKRLQLDAERRNATYRAQAQADAAARGHLADRLETLDRQLVAGVEVVARLRADLARRDDEVVLLHKQVEIERELNAD